MVPPQPIHQNIDGGDVWLRGTLPQGLGPRVKRMRGRTGFAFSACKNGIHPRALAAGFAEGVVGGFRCFSLGGGGHGVEVCNNVIIV